MAAKNFPNFMGIRVSDKQAVQIQKEMHDKGISMTEVVRRALAIYLGDK